MKKSTTGKLGKVIEIDEGRIRDHLGKMVRGTVEEALNGMLDAEADRLCKATRYQRSPERIDTRAGHYQRLRYSLEFQAPLRYKRNVPVLTVLISYPSAV